MKTQRQAKIIEIVSTRDVDTQEQLLELLHEAGFNSTQATISRDIKELRIVKELSKYGSYRYMLSSKEAADSFSNRLNTIFRESVTGFDYACNVVVVHTIPGLATAAAAAVDSMEMESILGSIGGDDTVIIVMRNEEAAATFCNDLKRLLG